MSRISTFERESLPRFKDKSALILVVNSFAPERVLYSTALKQLGFTNIHCVPDHKLALGVMESEFVDWIISPLQKGESVNLFHLAFLCQRHEHLKDIMITCSLSESEEATIPCLAEAGFFSWFRSTPTLPAVVEMLEETLEAMSSNSARISDVTVNLLSEFLNTNRNYPFLISLYKGLTSLYPGEPQILLKLAEAYLLAGEKKLGSLTLQQIALLDDDLGESVQALANNFLGGKLPSIQVGSTKENPFGFKYAILVGLEVETRDLATKLLGDFGVPSEVVEKPQDALELIGKKGEPSLMLINWELPVIPGPMFLQRLREMSCFSVINIVMGQNLDKTDYALLYEMCISQVLPTSCSRDDLLKSIVWAVQEDRRPMEIQSLFAKGRQRIMDNKIDEAIGCKDSLAKLTPTPDAEVLILGGEILLAKNEANKALTAGIESFKIGGDPVLCLNLMGKSFAKMGEFDKAFQAFDQAQILSPLNVQRLTAMAEVKFELGDHDASAQLIESAENLDEGSSLPDASKAKIAIAEGNSSDAKSLLQKLDSIRSVVSFLNNKAVSLASDASYDEAAKLYQEALDAIPDEHKQYRSVVNFNLGLLFLRWGKMEKARAALRSVSPEENENMANRAASLIKTIDKATESKSKVRLEQKKDVPKMNISDADAQILKRSLKMMKRTKFTLKKGERFLYHVFVTSGHPAEYKKALVSLPGFKAKEFHEEGDKRVWA